MALSEEINIPQKPPMVMIDRLARISGSETETLLTIRKDNVFVDDGLFTEAGLIENMAQTAAAGVEHNAGSGNKPAPGFIGSIRNLNIYILPPVGVQIKTIVKVEHEVGDATVVKGEIFLNNNLSASCEMNIFRIINHE
jgi:predicted hotdog family 3-hydroxylacyl-ACP dehydratase